MRPGAPLRERSAPSSGAKAWVTMRWPARLTVICCLKSSILWWSRGSRHGDAGIVDETKQGLARERSVDLLRGCRDCRFVRHVEYQRREVRAEFLCQPLRVNLFAHAAEHAKAARD